MVVLHFPSLHSYSLHSSSLVPSCFISDNRSRKLALFSFCHAHRGYSSQQSHRLPNKSITSLLHFIQVKGELFLFFPCFIETIITIIIITIIIIAIIIIIIISIIISIIINN